MENKTPKIILILFLSILVIGLSVFFVNVLMNKNFKLEHFKFQTKISNELAFNQEYETIFKVLNVGTVYKLNKKVKENKIKDLILLSEALHEKKISQIADKVTYFPYDFFFSVISFLVVFNRLNNLNSENNGFSTSFSSSL